MKESKEAVIGRRFQQTDDHLVTKWKPPNSNNFHEDSQKKVLKMDKRYWKGSGITIINPICAGTTIVVFIIYTKL